jgi:hypothetical protein
VAKVIPMKKHNEMALIYYAAREFVHLSFQQKFNIGFQMGLIDHYDGILTEDLLEERIFSKALQAKSLDELMTKVRLERCNESC